ncbi:hypothetical protein KKA15_05250 [Patescibacteria group bacterium]|nr:hypothetical protein [Patescibacteria group bacterium]
MGREYDSNVTKILRFFISHRLGGTLVKKIVIWILIEQTNYFIRPVYVTLSKRVPEFKELGQSLEEFLLCYQESINNILDKAGTDFAISIKSQKTWWKITVVQKDKVRPAERVIIDFVDVADIISFYPTIQGRARKKAKEWGVPIRR